MKKIGIVILGMLIHLGAMADELDLYKGVPQQVPARIMLLVDTSKSMDDPLTTSNSSTTNTSNGCDSKLCILKATLEKYVDAGDTHPDIRWSDDFEIGLARYEDPGAKILEPIAKLGSIDSNGQTHRQNLADAISALVAHGSTPLVGAYMDVLNYLKGERPAFAITQSSSIDSVWVDESTKDLFKTGMNSDLVCGVNDNHIVVLTDGASNGEDTSTETLDGNSMANRIKQFVTGDVNATGTLSDCPATIVTDMNLGQQSLGNTQIYSCATELAQALANVSADGAVQGVRTHVIAYNLDDTSDPNARTGTITPVQGLKNWAAAGHGDFFAANDPSGLDDAFSSITTKVMAKDSFTGAVPGVGINQSNRFTFLDDIYFSVFKPTGARFWYGNLKKYKLGWENNAPVILDSRNRNIDGGNGAGATPDGFIDSDVVSFWLNPDDYSLTTPVTADGDNVLLGGSAMRIPAKDQRRLYTTVNGTTTLLDTSALSDVSTEMLPSSPTSAETSKISDVLDWVRGVDADQDNEWSRESPTIAKNDSLKNVRTMYGSSIHSGPVVVNYTSTKQVNGKPVALAADQQKNLVFVSANDGKLYAVDSATGDEKLAFIPEDFLKRPSDSTPSLVETMYDAARSNEQGNLIYGLDSTWTVWRQDVNRDGNITDSNTSQDFVYLYGGMRRGGSNYYALDMTGANDSSPTMSQLFELKGGQGDFQNMGQTWSRPVLGMIKYKGESVVVMIVGGGYDPVYDSGRPTSTPKGAQLYIVAARERGGANNIHKGDVLWWASASGTGTNHVTISALTQSIPSTVKVLDADGDGYLDHIYVGDLGGQLLRFDINNDNTGSSNLISNTGNVVVAQLGVVGHSNTDANDRRFFYPPSIALMKDNVGKYVGIAIGSGNLVNPRGTDINEKFYFIKDYKALGGTTDPDIFSQDLGLQSEKLLGSPLIVQGTAYFTTYYWDPNAQTTTSASECHAAYGRSALYTYTPGDDAVTLIQKNRPQNLGGSIVTLLQQLPAVTSPDGTVTTPGRLKLTGLTGPGAINLPDVDFGNIRKTRWKQCETAACP